MIAPFPPILPLFLPAIRSTRKNPMEECDARVFVSGSLITGLSPNLTIHVIRHRRYLKVTPSVTLKRHSQALVAPVPLLVAVSHADVGCRNSRLHRRRQRRFVSAVFYERAVIIRRWLRTRHQPLKDDRSTNLVPCLVIITVLTI